jgi:hypothetical protein
MYKLQGTQKELQKACFGKMSMALGFMVLSTIISFCYLNTEPLA